jgi:hypothetical protein
MGKQEHCVDIIDTIITPMYNQLIGGPMVAPLFGDKGDAAGKIICMWRYPNEMCAVSFCIHDPKFGYTMWIWEPKDKNIDKQLLFPKDGAPIDLVHQLLGNSLYETLSKGLVCKNVWKNQCKRTKRRHQDSYDPYEQKMQPHTMLSKPSGWD